MKKRQKISHKKLLPVKNKIYFDFRLVNFNNFEMLDDIKKILEISKKGIVIMESGKPAYVVVPFDDYVKNIKNAKTASNREEGNYLLDKTKEENFKNKAPSLENIFEEDLNFSDKDDVFQKNNSGNESLEELHNQKKDLREIRLEDLPF